MRRLAVPVLIAVVILGVATGAIGETERVRVLGSDLPMVQIANVVPETSAAIPKSWRLVAVSNGDKLNANNLWFEDRDDGSLYLVQVFMDRGILYLREEATFRLLRR